MIVSNQSQPYHGGNMTNLSILETTVNATHNPNNIDKIEPSLKSSQECFTTPCQLANLNNNNKVGPNIRGSHDCFTTASQFANPNNIVKIEPSLKSSQDCFTTACQSVIPNSTTKVETNAKNSKGNYKTFSKLAILQTPSSSLEEITSQFSSEIYTVNYLVPATGFNPSNNTKTYKRVQFIDIKIGTHFTAIRSFHFGFVYTCCRNNIKCYIFVVIHYGGSI